MRADVLVEDGLLPEAFRTLRAHVGFLARVDSDVLIEYRFLYERLKKKQKKIREITYKS